MPHKHSSSPISSHPILTPKSDPYASSRTGAVRDIRQQGAQKRTTKKVSRLAKMGWTLSAQKRKALIASGAVATLVVAIILPDQVSSEAIAQTNCLEVVQSGAEMSRDEISSLITLPVGSPKQSVRQAMSEPYCTLPTESTDENAAAQNATEAQTASSNAEREAYPLAFDPEVWIVLNYEAEKYIGYDFVFKQ